MSDTIIIAGGFAFLFCILLSAVIGYFYFKEETTPTEIQSESVSTTTTTRAIGSRGGGTTAAGGGTTAAGGGTTPAGGGTTPAGGGTTPAGGGGGGDVDCVGEWEAEWSACKDPTDDTHQRPVACGTVGKKYKNWIITQERSGSGRACINPEDGGLLTEDSFKEDSCNGAPCSISCIGAWGPWGSCRQSRTVTGDPERVGLELSGCAKGCRNGGTSCGMAGGTSGEQMRTYNISRAAEHGGEPCPYAAGIKQFQSCSKHTAAGTCRVQGKANVVAREDRPGARSYRR